MITAKQLKYGRQRLEMTQKKFAAAAGVSEQTIRRLERLPGELRGYACTIQKIEETLTTLGVAFVDGGAIIKRQRP